ncbi:hypothetical protein VTN49DRAFT_4479 [Thermomyces lanuginosus]|uniref:uncharacterized protein n=1 Tax=Thermomyces lanuginosus TaxID=5541 RepID=UPI0037424A09
MSSGATPTGTQSQPDLNRSTPNPQAAGDQPQTTQQQQHQMPVAGGAPARVYMNEKIVPYLLEGMKVVAKEQPPNPLRVLGEFLIQKSNEIESRGSQS